MNTYLGKIFEHEDLFLSEVRVVINIDFAITDFDISLDVDAEGIDFDKSGVNLDETLVQFFNDFSHFGVKFLRDFKRFSNFVQKF